MDNNDVKKMEIEKNCFESKVNKNIEPMEEEIEIHQMNNKELQQQNKKKEEINKSIESNGSISTNNSNNSVSMDKIIKDLDNFNNENEDLLTIFKIDKVDKKQQKYKHLFTEEFSDEMYTNLILDEKNAKLKINKNYIKQQSDINAQMRAILVDWIIEVHNQFHFKRKTLFQTILLIDLYLSLRLIQKPRLQLLGIACLLISVKANEVYYPRLEDFINITDNAYTKKELLNMEILVLKTLNFDFLFPTSEEFYSILSKNYHFNKVQHHLGEYFMDSSLIDYNMLKYKASTIAIACTYIVMKYYNINGYKDLYLCKIISGESTQKNIKECARDLCYLIKNLSKTSLTSTKIKYSSEEYDNVATLCQEK